MKIFSVVNLFLLDTVSVFVHFTAFLLLELSLYVFLLITYVWFRKYLSKIFIKIGKIINNVILYW